MQYLSIFLLIPIIIMPSVVFADESIPITYSGAMTDVIFDGRWSFETEWKQSSLNTYAFTNDQVIILRSAHQGDFVYLFIDAINDYTLDNNLDSAIVCFDTNNDKTDYPNEDDYCFTAILGDDMGRVYRGDVAIQNFTQISAPEGFTGVGAISDNNDRYSLIPHTGYEFKIPTEIIGRKQVYGFYFAVYDANSQKYYSYPQNATADTIIVSPALWGEIYSPDKSLPEFSLPLLLLLPAFSVVLFLTKYKLGNIS